MRHNLASKSLFPRERNTGCHQGTQDWDTPEIQSHHKNNGPNGGEAGAEPEPPSLPQARGTGSELGGRLGQRCQKGWLWYHQKFWNVSPPFQAHWLTSVQALGLAQVGVGPRVRPAVLCTEHETIRKERHDCPAAYCTLAIQVVT